MREIEIRESVSIRALSFRWTGLRSILSIFLVIPSHPPPSYFLPPPFRLT